MIWCDVWYNIYCKKKKNNNKKTTTTSHKRIIISCNNSRNSNSNPLFQVIYKYTNIYLNNRTALSSLPSISFDVKSYFSLSLSFSYYWSGEWGRKTKEKEEGEPSSFSRPFLSSKSTLRTTVFLLLFYALFYTSDII